MENIVCDSVVRLFWSNVDQNGSRQRHMNSRCWEWIGGHSDGYGRIIAFGGSRLAHRISWMIHKGEIPEIENSDVRGTCVLHRCDNRSCVNPNHLFVGTHRDNMRDMAEKGRCVSNPMVGEECNLAKLTNAQVRFIRSSHANVTQSYLAKIFGINQSQISRIINGKVWTHVLPTEYRKLVTALYANKDEA